MKDGERHGTGDKEEKSVNGTQISIGKPLGSFHRENGTTFSGIQFFPEIFQWNEPKNHVPFTTQPEFPEFFGKWKTPRITNLTGEYEFDLFNRLVYETVSKFYNKGRKRIFV